MCDLHILHSVRDDVKFENEQTEIKNNERRKFNSVYKKSYI